LHFDLDVVNRLGFRILRGEVLNCAKYGIWSYHHGDNRINRGGPAGFWEVIDGHPQTGSVLQILNEDLDGGTVLYRSYSQTDRVFVHRNKNNFYWKTLSFLPRILEELYTSGEDLFLSKIKQENQHPIFYSEKIYKTPQNLEFIYLILKHYGKYIIQKILSLLYIEQWIILYDISRSHKPSSSFWRYKKIVPSKDRYWADPFIIFEDGKYYLFVEEFIYETQKAHISCITMDQNGSYSTAKKVLERSYHLSYPFVFRHNNDYFMIPESAANRTIELYKCTKFPNEWEIVDILMKDIYAVDTTIWKHNGLWWLFTNIRENDGGSSLDELFLFYSGDLFCTHWQPHTKNPIVSDVKSSRPARRIFSYNNNFYRSSQNNIRRYGYGMKINQIVTITENDYNEISINDIEPHWDREIIATHTLNFCENLTVIDGLVRRARYFN
jgi:hypothetical protein